MNRDLLHTVLKQFQVHFVAFFPAVTTSDLQVILAGECEMLLHVLQERYGYTHSQAKGAWNEFILHHVDGQSMKAGQDFRGRPAQA